MTALVPPTRITRPAGDIVRVDIDGRHPVEGALLQNVPVDAGLPETFSIVASDRVLHVGAMTRLKTAGWEPVDPARSLPPVQRLPFLADITFTMTTANQLRKWHRPSWLTEPVIPTQRFWFDPGTGPEIVTCLAATYARASDRHDASADRYRALAEPAPLRERPTFTFLALTGTPTATLSDHGWVELPTISTNTDWQARIDAATAFQTHVEYLLNAPIPTHVTLHDPSRLTGPAWETLDDDVADLAVAAVTDARYDHTVPQTVHNRVHAYRRTGQRSASNTEAVIHQLFTNPDLNGDAEPDE